jgi:hypothetical protein
LAIARGRRGRGGRGQLPAERVLDVMGVTSVEDRCRNSPQADFTALLPVDRIGLLLRPNVIAIHLIFSLNGFDPSPGRGVEQTEVKKDRTSPTYAGDSWHVPKAILRSSERRQNAPAPADTEPIHPDRD